LFISLFDAILLSLNVFKSGISKMFYNENLLMPYYVNKSLDHLININIYLF